MLRIAVLSLLLITTFSSGKLVDLNVLDQNKLEKLDSSSQLFQGDEDFIFSGREASTPSTNFSPNKLSKIVNFLLVHKYFLPFITKDFFGFYSAYSSVFHVKDLIIFIKVLRI